MSDPTSLPPPQPPPGQPLPREIPPELDRWNWGAFLLHWVWGAGNGTPIALLTWVPVLGILVMPFVLGAKGSAWAWRNARWDGVEHFRRVQRRWAIWGVIVWIGIGGLAAAIGVTIVYGPANSDPYPLVLKRLDESQLTATVLGRPISIVRSSNSYTGFFFSAWAEYDLTATGPKGRGRVAAKLRGDLHGWRITFLELVPAGSTQPIDVLRD